MPVFPQHSALFLVSCLSLALAASAPEPRSWSSPLLGRELVVIEKAVPDEDEFVEPQPVPEAVRALLGPDFVEYESFVAAVLSEADAQTLTATTLAEGRSVLEDPRSPVVLPFHTFDPGVPGERTAPWAVSSIRPKPVPDLALLRFAFPLKEEWVDGLRACGVHPVLYYGNGTFLANAKTLDAISNCQPVARYLSWAGDFLTTDRISPEVLDRAVLDLMPYTLAFAPGTGLETALKELPAVVQTGESMTWDDGTLTLGVLAGRPELETLIATSLHLLAIHEAEGEPEPSDERQGQIASGNYAGASTGAVAGAVTSPGTYLSWLTGRSLRTSGGHPIVAVFDTGYDDGSGVGGSYHPDLAGKLVAEGNYVLNWNTPAIEDTRGHGTMVAGIIAGNGTLSGKKDKQGFYLGTGIAPDVKLVAVQVMDSKDQPPCVLKHSFGDPPTKIDEAIAFSRVAGAVIGNHSWNMGFTTYDSMARLFDQRVIDGAPSTPGLQPMTMVVAAGNAGIQTGSGILSPANAKNVIAVGATQSYRPSTQSEAPPNACTLPLLNTALYTREADNIAEVSAFSSRGTPFTPLGQAGVRLHTVRIKPDLVAPGGRVTSTVPYDTHLYKCQTLCRMFWPEGQYYSISSGTSFAAPVVSGIAALATKWFSDKGLPSPSPSLIKAALIATATDLGLLSGGDHRPSRAFGWGRVNLERLTDPAVDRFFVTDNQANAVMTGQERPWTRTIDNPAKDTLIVLAWSDPASGIIEGQAPLINDLRLKVERTGSSFAWYGNNFRENIAGDDNGYSYQYSSAASAKTDNMNTVEAVFIPANTFAAGQKLTIRVTGTNVQAGPQKFAVYAYNLRRNS